MLDLKIPLYHHVSVYYDNPKDNSIFFRVKEEWGGLSNMSNDFPIEINGYKIANTEALYQACRFPNNPEIQREIIIQRSGLAAKMKSKKYRNLYTRPDWNDVRIDIMRFCLQLKLTQNEVKFSKLLDDTGDTEIVERSSKDKFWGAVWDNATEVYIGNNILGKLLMEVRTQYRERQVQLFDNGSFGYEFIETLPIPNFKLLGHLISYPSA